MVHTHIRVGITSGLFTLSSRETLPLSVENSQESTDYVLSTFSLCDVNCEIDQGSCSEWVARCSVEASFCICLF
jgi:hypothetical protein